MKKQQYIAAVACLVAGAIGFVSVYATEKGKERKEQEQNISQETQQLSPASYEVEPKTTDVQKTENSVQNIVKETEKKDTEKKEKKQDETREKEKTVETAATQQHFLKDKTVWPIEGEILLDYSMDKTIYFPTLEQYRCNPAVVIQGSVNDKVRAMSRGKITKITENEETGCTVFQNLGDGYTAIYGQLKELNFSEGDLVDEGQVIGYVSEPTKYYSSEGSNVYFCLEKDGKAVDPKKYLPEMTMNTLE